MNYLHELVGEEIKFTRELEDISLSSGDKKATFECELSTEGPTVNWTKDNSPLYTDSRIHIQSQGRTHRLIIDKPDSRDVGKYTATYDENLSTTAALFVIGNMYGIVNM